MIDVFADENALDTDEDIETLFDAEDVFDLDNENEV